MSAGLRFAAVDPCLAQDISARAAIATSATKRVYLVKLQHRHDRFLRNLNRAHPLHPSLAFLLLFEELALARHVAPITLGQDVLSHCRDGLASDYLTADGRLDWNLIELTRDDRLQLLDQLPSLSLRLAAVGDQGKGVHRLPGDKHIELDQVAFPESDHLVVHRGVAQIGRAS